MWDHAGESDAEDRITRLHTRVAFCSGLRLLHLMISAFHRKSEQSQSTWADSGLSKTGQRRKRSTTGVCIPSV